MRQHEQNFVAAGFQVEAHYGGVAQFVLDALRRTACGDVARGRVGEPGAAQLRLGEMVEDALDGAG